MFLHEQISCRLQVGSYMGEPGLHKYWLPLAKLFTDAAAESWWMRRTGNKGESFNPEINWEVWLHNQIEEEVDKEEKFEITLYMVFWSFFQILKAF